MISNARGFALHVFGVVCVIATTANGCTEKTASQPSATHSLHEAHCKEPMPAFTLGEHSNPTKEQEIALCSCIWSNLGAWERRASEKMSQGNGAEVSFLDRTAFPSRFGRAIKQCGGMDL
jgi:hypothetical protein